MACGHTALADRSRGSPGERTGPQASEVSWRPLPLATFPRAGERVCSGVGHWTQRTRGQKTSSKDPCSSPPPEGITLFRMGVASPIPLVAREFQTQSLEGDNPAPEEPSPHVGHPPGQGAVHGPGPELLGGTRAAWDQCPSPATREGLRTEGRDQGPERLGFPGGMINFKICA